MSYVLVGEVPSMATVGKPDRWLDPDEACSVAYRIARHLGWSADQFREAFPVRTNLWATPRRKWPSEAKAKVAAIKTEAVKHDGIVLIGRRVADAFGLGDWPPVTWNGNWIRPIALLPYPSGSCYWWRDPAHSAQAKEFFLQCVSQLPS